MKYVVCNADEGDPGAYMNRSTIEGDPHSLVEAMAICGYTIGAKQGYIYIRAEYPLAIERLKIAIKQAKEYGLLGDEHPRLGLRLRHRDHASAQARSSAARRPRCSQSIEGKRGMPVPKPPFPAVRACGRSPPSSTTSRPSPTSPPIMPKGAEWYAKIGTEKSKGTKVFALTGKIANTGLVEVPMGMTLREIIYDIGGGIPGGKTFKAVQTGGPSGGCIPRESLDVPIDYESPDEAGSMMGSGGMIIMDEDDCVVDIAKFYMAFCVDESCGKCAPCRIGTSQMHDLLDKISRGFGTEEDLAKLEKIGKAMTKASLCMLGGSAANPTASTIKHFREEYLEHIRDHKCRAGKCKDLVVYSIDPVKCIGCHICAKKCPVPCIAGQPKQAHVIDQCKCVKCGECFKACKFGAVLKN